ncbi:MAG: cyclic nucleotide-binding domain-containing protein [Defluviitaleaceae bacterium]|nr:cyclic nucleotide-binding domain-containing protein [Defluviitaleaceae bacterium]
MRKYPVDGNDLELLLRYRLRGVESERALRIVFEQGEYLLREGEPIEYMYFVSSGKAKVFLSLSDGKRLLLAYFVSDGIIGEVELMTGSRSAGTTIQAVTEFVCVALPLGSCANALKANVAFVNHVAGELAGKLVQRSVNGAITTLQPLEFRLCAYIIQTESGGIFRETLTEVAGVVGASYRHLLRRLDKLCADRVLRKEPGGYRILDHQVLLRKAGDLYVLK